MLIESYRLEVETSTHSVEEFEYEVVAYLEVDLSPVLPYLNATLSRALYLPDEPVLSWRHEGHNIGFWPDRCAPSSACRCMRRRPTPIARGRSRH